MTGGSTTGGGSVITGPGSFGSVGSVGSVGVSGVAGFCAAGVLLWLVEEGELATSSVFVSFEVSSAFDGFEDVVFSSGSVTVFADLEGGTLSV